MSKLSTRDFILTLAMLGIMGFLVYQALRDGAYFVVAFGLVAILSTIGQAAYEIKKGQRMQRARDILTVAFLLVALVFVLRAML
jgi:hypothetical protein